jgi:hypothetical protein
MRGPKRRSLEWQPGRIAHQSTPLARISNGITSHTRRLTGCVMQIGLHGAVPAAMVMIYPGNGLNGCHRPGRGSWPPQLALADNPQQVAAVTRHVARAEQAV